MSNESLRGFFEGLEKLVEIVNNPNPNTDESQESENES